MSKIKEGLLGSKTNPIKISSYEETKNLKRGTYYITNCIRCGAEFKRTYVEYRTNQMYCTKCSKSLTTQHYGVDNPAKSKQIMEKIQKTNLEKYGNICSVHGKEPHKKAEKSFQEHYGVSWVNESKELQDKAKKTLKEKYNVNCAFLVGNSLEKSKKTRLNKYGASMGLKQYQYKYNNNIFDSKWELYYYIYNIDHHINIIRNETYSLKYIFNGKEHKYFPDFIINEKLIEIKSSYWIKMQKEEPNGEEKFKCMKKK